MPIFSRFMRYFMAVARCGSIRKASEELHIAASAIDRQILQGEAALGTALFERLPSGLRLTTAGEYLLASGKDWSRDLAALRTRIADLSGLRRGEVDLAVIDALALGFVPRLIRRLRDTHPGITIRSRVLDNRDIGAAIMAGEVDCGLLLNPEHTPDLLVRAHIAFPLGFVCLPDHPVARLDHARFSLCEDYPLVMPEPPLALRRQIDILQAGAGIAVQEVASSDNVQMLKSLVLEGVGIGLLTALDVMEEVRNGALAFVPITGAALAPLTLALCVNRSRPLSRAARLLIDEIEKSLPLA